jgi:CubicO group peptidase (beta-lactamase class C family)
LFRAGLSIGHPSGKEAYSRDDPVSKYVAGVPNGDKITIAHLLEMRSGLYNYTNAKEAAASIDNNPAKAWSPAEALAIAFAPTHLSAWHTLS